MSNTFKKTSVRGFTLIELLVVIAIIGLLATIIAAPIQSARKKARDAKKIAELKSTQLALEQYAESNQAQYPVLLTSLSPQFMPLLSSFASATSSTNRDAFGYVTYEALALGGASSTFSYHLGVKLEVYGPALETDRDCISATLSNALIDPACAVYNGNTMFASQYINGANISTAGATTTTTVAAGFPSTFQAGSVTAASYSGTDFQTRWYAPKQANAINNMSEEASSTCVGVTDCVFDVTGQQ